MSDGYETPTPNQLAKADQNMAGARDVLDRLVARVQRGDLDPGFDRTISIGLAVADELDPLQEDNQLPAAIAVLAVAIDRATRAGGGE